MSLQDEERAYAWQLIVQHSCIRHQQDVLCRLLATAKVLRDCVVRHCRAACSVTCCNRKSAPGLAPWLSRNAQLVSTLSWNFESKGWTGEANAIASCNERAAAERALAAAFKAAAAVDRQQSLPLQSFKCATAGSAAHEVLQQLPRSNLTELYFGLSAELPTELPDTVQAAAAIGALTALQQLTLTSAGFMTIDWALPGLSALTNLTHLTLKGVESDEQLSSLPAQLQELQIDGDEGIWAVGTPPGHLSIGHLTALTKLHCHLNFKVRPHDVLPPNLREVRVGDCPLAQPLLQLQQLETLAMLVSTTPADELQRIGRSCSSLRCVKLTYWDEINIIAAAAPGWHGVPLLHLELAPTEEDSDDEAALQQHLAVIAGGGGGGGGGGAAAAAAGAAAGTNSVSQTYTAAILEHLSRLTQLTYLSMNTCTCLGVTTQKLTPVLRQLSTLRALKLVELQSEREDDAAAAAGQLGASMNAAAAAAAQQAVLPAVLQPAAAAGAPAAAAVATGAAPPGAVAATAGGQPLPGGRSINPEVYRMVPAPSYRVGAGMVPLARAICSMRQLQSLTLIEVPLGDMAAIDLGSVTSLTQLHLNACELTDCGVVAMACGLTRLRQLSLARNERITNLMSVVITVMKDLERLDVRATAVNASGVARILHIKAQHPLHKQLLIRIDGDPGWLSD